MTDAEVLDYDPWGDDDSGYRVLSNRMVVTRKPSECAICFEAIPVAARVRAQSEVLDGKAKTFRFCVICCEAMARATTCGADCDYGESIEPRYDTGRKNAERAAAGK